MGGGGAMREAGLRKGVPSVHRLCTLCAPGGAVWLFSDQVQRVPWDEARSGTARA